MASIKLSSEKDRARRVRTFDGCGTCRRRHVKCDQLRPSCLTCEAVGVTCDGFVPDIRWMRPSDDGADASKATRRHLYSEDRRRQMSESMVSDLLGVSVDACLNEIDTKAGENTSSSSSRQVIVGPFTVLRPVPSASNQVTTTSDILVPTGPLHVRSSGRIPGNEFLSEMGTGSPLPNLYDVNALWNLDDSLQWDDLFELGFNNALEPTSCATDSSLPFLTPNLAQSSVAVAQSSSTLADPPISSGVPDYTSVLGAVQSSSLSNQVWDGEILELAPRLLKHFKKTVIEHVCALPITAKSPFEIINLSTAVDALAHLTFLQSNHVTLAKRAGLYGLLAVSAFHLSRNPRYDTESGYSPESWESISSAARDQAAKDLQRSINEESRDPNKAKYKDQVAATMNLMTYAIMAGARKDIRRYMTDLERLMRLRGLAKRIVSRKSRLLHHMYTWCRIVGESTYVLHDYTILIERLHAGGRVSHGSDTPKQHARSGPTSRLDDFLRFETHPVTKDREEIVVEGNEVRETALRDIHLEDSQDNPHSLYGLIYGIAEPWLRLLSQTTRLANHIDAMNTTGETSLNESLLQRAARLEDLVCSFAASQNTASRQATPNYHIHCALNSALVIFFYRRIRNVNSWILQSHVDAVIQALENFNQALVLHDLVGPGTVWPAFVAGCEAMAAAKRDRLIRWIETAESKTALICYTQAKEVLQEVWNRQKHNGRGAIYPIPATWVDILREKKLWLVAC